MYSAYGGDIQEDTAYWAGFGACSIALFAHDVVGKLESGIPDDQQKLRKFAFFSYFVYIIYIKKLYYFYKTDGVHNNQNYKKIKELL